MVDSVRRAYGAHERYSIELVAIVHPQVRRPAAVAAPAGPPDFLAPSICFWIL